VPSITSTFGLSRLFSLVEDLRRREDRLALALSLVIGALVGLIVVAFILLTGRLAAHMYPAGGAAWRRVLVPTLGALVTGILLARAFPDARGSSSAALRRWRAGSRWGAKGRRCTSDPDWRR
jgi:H+/Cl- antiporter ClcA